MDTVHRVHGLVLITGSRLGITEAKRELDQDYHISRYRDQAMLVHDVADYELRDLNHVAQQYGLTIDDVRETYDYIEPRKAEFVKTAELDLLQGQWYTTNQKAFPLVHVKEIWHEVDDNQDVWLFNVDLVAEDALPMPITLTSDQLKEYKLKPAKIDDFIDLDITPPAGLDPDPHLNEDVEDYLGTESEDDK